LNFCTGERKLTAAKCKESSLHPPYYSGDKYKSRFENGAKLFLGKDGDELHADRQGREAVARSRIIDFFFNPMPHMSFTDFVVFPSGHGRSVTDF